MAKELKKIEHVFFEGKDIDGNDVEYSDFTLYYTNHLIGRSNALYLDYHFWRKICDDELRLVNTTKAPAGSNLYIASQLSTPSDAIRKKYNIKLDPDKADYIVLANNEKRTRRVFFPDYIVFPEKKIVVASYYNHPVSDILPLLSTDITNSTKIVGSNNLFLWILSDSKQGFLKYLTGQHQKPIVHTNNLDLDGNDKITIDVMKMTHSIGAAELENPNNDVENMDLNLKAIYNYNWRKYKCSVGLMMRQMLYVHGCGQTVFYYYHRYKRFWSKSSKELIEQCLNCYNPVSHEDKEMARTFMKSILDLPKLPMCAGFNTLCRKLQENRISNQEFQNIFSVQVRIA